MNFPNRTRVILLVLFLFPAASLAMPENESIAIEKLLNRVPAVIERTSSVDT